MSDAVCVTRALFKSPPSLSWLTHRFQIAKRYARSRSVDVQTRPTKRSGPPQEFSAPKKFCRADQSFSDNEDDVDDAYKVSCLSLSRRRLTEPVFMLVVGCELSGQVRPQLDTVLDLQWFFCSLKQWPAL